MERGRSMPSSIKKALSPKNAVIKPDDKPDKHEEKNEGADSPSSPSPAKKAPLHKLMKVPANENPEVQKDFEGVSYSKSGNKRPPEHRI